MTDHQIIQGLIDRDGISLYDPAFGVIPVTVSVAHFLSIFVSK